MTGPRAWPTPTGRLLAEERPDVGACLVVELAEAWRALPVVGAALGGGRAFLERPMVFGVAPLVADEDDHRRLVYATGRAVPVAALLDEARGRRVPLGPRAAVELGWLAAATLVDAAAAGPLQGVFCHGDVSPWRLAVQASGGLTLLGHGLPELEAVRARRAGEAPAEAAARYAPPERAAGGLEDVRSDLFSLALVLVEVATGAPLLGADARAADALDRLARVPRLPAPLADVLAGLLATRPEARRSPDAVVRALEALARQPLPGAPLAELVAAGVPRPTPDEPPARATATRTFVLSSLKAPEPPPPVEAPRAVRAPAPPPFAPPRSPAPPPVAPRPVAPPSAPPIDPDVARPRRAGAPPTDPGDAPPPPRPRRPEPPPEDLPDVRPRRAPDEPREP